MDRLPVSFSTVVFAVNTSPSKKLRCVEEGGIYGACENEIFASKVQNSDQRVEF